MAKCCGPVGSLGAEHRHKEDRGKRHPQANGFHREDLRDTTPWPVNLWHALRCSRMHEIRAGRWVKQACSRPREHATSPRGAQI